MFYLLFLKHPTDVAIIQLWRECSRELIGNLNYEEAIFPCMLELALPIAIRTILVMEDNQVARCKLYGLYFLDEILGLNAISADILNGRSSYLSRYQRQVFHAITALLHGIGHYLVEGGTRPTMQIDTVGILRTF